jgi:hypothetical protein
MFPVVFLYLAFGVLVTFLVVLAMFLEVAFSPDLLRVRQTRTNEAREGFAGPQQPAVDGASQSIGRATLVKQSKRFGSRRISRQLGARAQV